MRTHLPRRAFLHTTAFAAAAILPGATAVASALKRQTTATPQRTFDVVVYSATPCGIVAAIAARREGARVLLIEPLAHVGGLSTSGVNTAEVEHMLGWTIGGIALEFYRRMARFYGDTKPAFEFESDVAERTYLDMLREAGVELRHGAAVASVERREGLVRSIGLTDGTTIAAPVFVDASYEGDLMARAGVPYSIGREARSEFDEEAAGIRFDRTSRQAPTVDAAGNLLPGISGWAKDYTEGAAHRGVMNYNFRLIVARDPALQVPIPRAARYHPDRYAILKGWVQSREAAGKPLAIGDILDFYPRRNGKFELNNKQAAIISLGHFGGQFDWPDADYDTRRKIYDDHLDYTLGLFQFLREDPSVPEKLRAQAGGIGLHKDAFVDNRNLPYQLYVREARRMRGAYVVTQHDVVDHDRRRKPDSIGMSSHFIDCHHVQRLAVSPTEFVNEGRIWRMGYGYQIPYRALTPRAEHCGNLLVPGAASFSHVAFCTYRLESVWMIAGHAAGVAAALAAKTNQAVQRIDVGELQNKLRAQEQIVDFVPGAPEKCERLNGPPEF